MTKITLEEIHKKSLAAQNQEEIAQVYSDWADFYDDSLINELNYVAPQECTQLFLKYCIDKNSKILDAGCGTGLVAEILTKHGYNSIDGIDYSEKMLKKADYKKIYQSLSKVDLNAELNINDHQYDAIICVGTFTLGHVYANALDEMIRITKDRGYICFTVREEAWQEKGFEQKAKNLIAQGKWQLLEQNMTDYIKAEGSKCYLCIYQINKD